jgi:cytochrome bd ubiquinol oxidase subunit II
MLADLAAVVIAIGLTAYVVLGGADFGTGIWDVTASGHEMRARIKRSMGPVWEANHVWLIFVLVMLWTAFPRAFGSITSTLALPLFVAAVGIILRGGAFALRGEAATILESRGLGAVFAVSSVLVPFFLGAAVGGIASGRVPVGNADGDAITSWWNETGVLVGLIAIVTGAHVAAVFLGADSHRAGQHDLVRAFRIRALGSGVVAGGLAIAGLFVVRSDAPDLYDGLTSDAGLACVIGSAAAGVITLALEWRSRFEPARYAAAAAVGAIVAGYVVAQQPYLLPPDLTVEEAAAPDATLAALLASVAVGLLILVPSLVWLFRLHLSGRLDTGSNT